MENKAFKTQNNLQNNLNKTKLYSDEQLESIITQVKPNTTHKPRYYLFKYLTALCSCLRPSMAQPQMLKEERTLLPPKSNTHIGIKTLVLDLDETLVHSSLKPVLSPDMIINIAIDNQLHQVYINIRPGVQEFLSKVSEIFEVIVFTASLAKYADPLLNRLDPDNKIHGRLFRDSCTIYNGSYVKDLSQLGRDIKDVIIVDNSPIAYTLQPFNAIPILSWFDDKADKELSKLIPVLEALAKIEDIPSTLKDLAQRQLKLTQENIEKLYENDENSQQQIHFLEEKVKSTHTYDGRCSFNSPAPRSDVSFKFETE